MSLVSSHHHLTMPSLLMMGPKALSGLGISLAEQDHHISGRPDSVIEQLSPINVINKANAVKDNGKGNHVQRLAQEQMPSVMNRRGSYPPFMLGTRRPHSIQSTLSPHGPDHSPSLVAPSSSPATTPKVAMTASPLSSPVPQEAGSFQPYSSNTQRAERSGTPEYVLVRTAVGTVAGVMVIGLGGILLWILIRRHSFSIKNKATTKEIRDEPRKPRYRSASVLASTDIKRISTIGRQEIRREQDYHRNSTFAMASRLPLFSQSLRILPVTTGLISQSELETAVGSRPRSVSLPIARATPSFRIHETSLSVPLDLPPQTYPRISSDSLPSSTETRESQSVAMSLNHTEESMTSQSDCASDPGRCAHLQEFSKIQCTNRAFVSTSNGVTMELDQTAPFLVLKYPRTGLLLQEFGDPSYLQDEVGLFGSASRDKHERRWPLNGESQEPNGSIYEYPYNNGRAIDLWRLRPSRSEDIPSFIVLGGAVDAEDEGDSPSQCISTEEESSTPSESGGTTGSLSTNNSYASIRFASTLLVDERLPPPSILVSAPTLATLSEGSEDMECEGNLLPYSLMAKSSLQEVTTDYAIQTKSGLSERFQDEVTDDMSVQKCLNSAREPPEDDLGLDWFGRVSFGSDIDDDLVDCGPVATSQDRCLFPISDDEERLYVSPFVIGDAESEDEDSTWKMIDCSYAKASSIIVTAKETVEVGVDVGDASVAITAIMDGGLPIAL